MSHSDHYENQPLFSSIEKVYDNADYLSDDELEEIMRIVTSILAHEAFWDYTRGCSGDDETSFDTSEIAAEIREDIELVPGEVNENHLRVALIASLDMHRD